MPQTGLQRTFLEHRAHLQRFLVARGAEAMAEDILQDMWIKLVSVELGAIGSALPYLYRMADNQLRDRFRTSARRRERERAWGEQGPAADDGIEQAYLSREQLAEANGALELLGPRTHAILVRYRLDGVTQRDIARELGVSLSLVEKHLQRAYRALGALRHRWLTEGDEPQGLGMTDVGG